MASEKYNLIFRGDIVLGHNILEVKQRLEKLFKTDATQIERLFTGRPVAIKKALPEAEAQRYQAALHKAGAEVELLVVGGVEESPASQVKPKRTLAERLAEQNPEPQESSGVIAFAPKSAREEQVKTRDDELGWVLAPAGSDLLAEQFRPHDEPPLIEPVDAELRPMQGNLLDDEELQDEVAPIGVDLSGISLAEPGGEILNEDEKPLPIPEVSLEVDFGVAPAGARMSDEPREVAPLNFDLSGISLAEQA